MKCNDCKKEFKINLKGCKIKPIPLCPHCNLMNKVVICENSNCKSLFKLKEGYLDECWTCGCPICWKCGKKQIIMKGIEFNFCEKHQNPNRRQLKEDAFGLLEEEDDINENEGVKDG